MNSELNRLSPIQMKQRSKLAVASMVLGILSSIPLFNYELSLIHMLVNWVVYFSVFMPMGILAFIFGIIALNRIHKNSNLKGAGFSITGLILGGIHVLFLLLVPLFLLGAIPH